MTTAPKTWPYGSFPWLPEADRLPGVKPRTRVIIDNDFAGDPDDLFALAHHLLLEGTEVRGVVVSRLREDDPWNRTGSSVRAGRERVEALLATMGVTGVDLYDGDDRGFDAYDGETAASRFIVTEALRQDDRPLYLVAGGSLGDVARALKAAPEIAAHLTLIWIGGGEHPGLAYVPEGGTDMEYNLALDPASARYVFNDTQARIWQIPRDVYRSATVSMPTIRRGCARAGAVGAYLLSELNQVRALVAGMAHPGATYVLGDQPLVLLSSLQTTFEPDAASSYYEVIPTPRIAEDGTYRYPQDTRPMRRYRRLDNRLLFDDMFDSLAALAAWQEG
ncbi:MAG: nucleoside hydrolase [Actinomyces ruminicola]|uniref:Inosine-uridine nucleoside N-ribohydrolase n=1 Tax=Actinomyces ruminicola TaxID=332524 RepID=A0A1G9ZLD7_9ACTO|nr:nucleoside hydrolase [Actinomyces ruminicola]MBE6481913.1 nucleoside hydrolase [Actinomyces ruminicola]SDN21791.1 Inosine-uridine nucleoside N-ribohydrolase [Actinomyces ruminicola]